MKDGRGVETKLPARLAPFKAAGNVPLPPLDARYLFDWLMEIGPGEVAGMGQGPISWTAIDAWARRTFQRPSAWEVRTLRRLSAEYLAELHAAEDQYRAAPWTPTGRAVDHDANLRQLQAVLG